MIKNKMSFLLFSLSSSQPMIILTFSKSEIKNFYLLFFYHTNKDKQDFYFRCEYYLFFIHISCWSFCYLLVYYFCLLITSKKLSFYPHSVHNFVDKGLFSIININNYPIFGSYPQYLHIFLLFSNFMLSTEFYFFLLLIHKIINILFQNILFWPV